jgi:hypothetical protein
MVRAGPILLVAAFAALCPAAAPGAPSSGFVKFADPVGDAKSAGDITAVEVANDNAGAITFRVDLANRPAPDRAEFINVYLGTDFRRETGWYGLDYMVEYAGNKDKATLYRWESTGWAVVEDAVKWRYDNGVRITIHRADIGDVWTFRFVVKSRRPSGRSEDTYPDQTPLEQNRYDIDRYDIRIPLLLEDVSIAPKQPRRGSKLVVRMTLSAEPGAAGAPVVACRGTLAGKRLPGTGQSRLGPEPAEGERRGLVATCTWKAVRRGLFRGRVAATFAGAVAARELSFRVR